MLREALEYIVNLGGPHMHTDAAGRVFAVRQFNPIHPPLIEPLVIRTLSSLGDLLDEGFENCAGNLSTVIVESPTSVSVVGDVSDEWSRRTYWLRCHLQQKVGFTFGQWLGHESFIIGVQANFTATDDRDYLLKIASNLSTERLRTSVDDGFSQQATLKSGIVLKNRGETDICSRVTLAPFRTFREVQQPASEFVFRLKDQGENAPPLLALFEADGGKWEIDAMENIGRWLRVRLGDNWTVVI